MERVPLPRRLSKHADRARYISFSPVYAKLHAAIISTQKYGTGITIKDLKNKKVAVVSGSATEKYLKGNHSVSLILITVADVPECLRAVAFGQADASVINLSVASYHISQQESPIFMWPGITDYVSDLRIGVSKKYPLLFSSIQKAMESSISGSIGCDSGSMDQAEGKVGVGLQKR